MDILSDGEQLWNLPSTILTGPANAIHSVAFSPGGHILAAGSADGKVWLWNLAGLPTRPSSRIGP
jgi:WD40 repeat protein